MVNGYWQRLEPALVAAKLQPADFARKLGISYQAVKKVMVGGSFGKDNNAKAAALLGLSSDWLATGKGPRERAELAAPSPPVSLPPEYRQLLIDLEDLLPRERSKWIDSIHQAAEYAREIREHAKKTAPSAVAHALREKPRASTSAKYGDGNERQQALPLTVVLDPFTAPPSERESKLYDGFKKAPK